MGQIEPGDREEMLLRGILNGDTTTNIDPVTRKEMLLKAILENGGGLPAVTAADNGKVAAVVDGEWGAASIPEGNLPPVTDADNSKVLAVVDGEWGLDSSWKLVEPVNLFDESKITEGKFMNANGAISNNPSYFYSGKIPVTEGDVVSFKTRRDTDGYYVVRTFASRVCAFDANGGVVSSAGVDSATYSYTVPTGIHSIVISQYISNMTDGLGMVVLNNDSILRYSPYFKSYWQSNDDFMPAIYESIKSSSLGESPEKATVASFGNGDTLSCGMANIRKNKVIHFKATIGTMGQFTIWNGSADGGYFESKAIIDATNVTVYTAYSNGYQQMFTDAHGLTLADYIDVTIESDEKSVSSITIKTNGDEYTHSSVYFAGRGAIEATSEGAVFTNVFLDWVCKDLKSPIWIFGDSYTQTTSTNYWTRHLIDEGYTDFYLCGHPGGKSRTVYPFWRESLKYGKPKFIVWALGMNDADASDQINFEWSIYFQLINEDCNALGITPIFTTIPNVPARNNTYKNDVIKASGKRYIDFAMAVGAESAGSGWYSGMLSSDNTHPTIQGAICLEKQALSQMPELME